MRLYRSFYFGFISFIEMLLMAFVILLIDRSSDRGNRGPIRSWFAQCLSQYRRPLVRDKASNYVSVNALFFACGSGNIIITFTSTPLNIRFRFMFWLMLEHRSTGEYPHRRIPCAVGIVICRPRRRSLIDGIVLRLVDTRAGKSALISHSKTQQEMPTFQ